MGASTVGGAASGAAAGFAVGGPIGAGIGAVFGGISGSLAGSAQAQLVKARRREGWIKDLAAARQRRDMVRNAYIARAEMTARALAGEEGASSSATRGAQSSIGTQMREQIGSFDLAIEYQRQAEKFYKKAGKYSAQAGAVSAVGDLLVSYMGYRQGRPPAQTGLTSQQIRGASEIPSWISGNGT